MDKLNVLNQFRNEYYKVDATMAEPQRTLQLSALMDKIQKEFNIPLLNNQTFNDKNKAIMQLYREISTARNI